MSKKKRPSKKRPSKKTPIKKRPSKKRPSKKRPSKKKRSVSPRTEAIRIRADFLEKHAAAGERNARKSGSKKLTKLQEIQKQARKNVAIAKVMLTKMWDDGIIDELSYVQSMKALEKKRGTYGLSLSDLFYYLEHTFLEDNLDAQEYLEDADY